MALEAPLTEDEALSLRREWRAVTDEEPEYDPDHPIRVSSLAALTPLAQQVPHSRWLGGESDQVYSAMITYLVLDDGDDEWTVQLFAGGKYADIRHIVENSRVAIQLPEES